MVGGAVVVRRGARTETIGVLHQIPRAHRPIGDVELHRSPTAAGEVQAVVGGRRGGERGLLHVDRGEQQPVDAEHALRLRVDRVEAGLPRRCDVRFGGQRPDRRVPPPATGRARYDDPHGCHRGRLSPGGSRMSVGVRPGRRTLPDRTAASEALAAVGVTAPTCTGGGAVALGESPIAPPRIAASTPAPSRHSASATSHALRSEGGVGVGTSSCTTLTVSAPP